MKQLTEAQLLRAMRRAYTLGWGDRIKFDRDNKDCMPSELTAFCHEADIERDAKLQEFANQV